MTMNQAKTLTTVSLNDPEYDVYEEPLYAAQAALEQVLDEPDVVGIGRPQLDELYDHGGWENVFGDVVVYGGPGGWVVKIMGPGTSTHPLARATFTLDQLMTEY